MTARLVIASGALGCAVVLMAATCVAAIVAEARVVGGFMGASLLLTCISLACDRRWRA